MKAIRLVLCAIGALAVLDVVSVGAASAEVCPPATGKGFVAICVNNQVLGAGLRKSVLVDKEPLTTSKLEVTGGPTVKCSSASGSGELVGGGSSASGHLADIHLSFSACEVTNTFETKSNCEVPNISTKNVVAKFSGEEAKKTTFEPETGTEFATVVIKNKGEKACTFKTAGSKVTGTQECRLPTALTELQVQEFKCEPSGSVLRYGATSSVAVFELAGELVLGESFSMKQL